MRQAHLVAQVLEKVAYGQQIDEMAVKSIVREKKARILLKGKRYMQGVKDFLNGWFQGRKETSFNNDKRSVNRFFVFPGSAENMPFDMVTVGHARNFMEAELERVSFETVRLYLTCVRTAFQKAVDTRIFQFNLFHRMNPGKLESMDKQELRAFTIEEVRRLADVSPGE